MNYWESHFRYCLLNIEKAQTGIVLKHPLTGNIQTKEKATINIDQAISVNLL